MDCWGDNVWGQLGNGTTGGPDGVSPFAGYDTPQAVTGITDAVSIAGDVGSSTCAVLSTGGVDCWGANSGQLGNGTVGGPDGENGYDTPQAVSGIADAASVTSDADGEYCAVLTTGGVDCWGYNGDGELGNGTIGGPDGEDGYDTPQAVNGITDALSVTSTTWSPSTTTSATVPCSRPARCTVGVATPLVNWERDHRWAGPRGRLRHPPGGRRRHRATSATTDASGNFGNCAVLMAGGMDCWGYNGDDELGSGTVSGPDKDGDDTPQAVRSL